MPFSWEVGKKQIAEMINAQVKDQSFRLLDLGCGYGTYGRLITKPCFKVGIDGVDYSQKFKLSDVYNEFYVHDIRDVKFLQSLGKFDLTVLGDVIEHMPPNQGRAVLDAVKLQSDWVLVAVPFMLKQDGKGNVWEHHWQDDLTEKVFMERYPDFKPLLIFNRYGYFEWRRSNGSSTDRN